MILESVSKDLDVRSKWLGLRQLKQPYRGNPYSRKDTDGKHIPMNRRAEAAATFLEKQIWADNSQDNMHESERWPSEAYPPVLEHGLGIDISPIRIEELIAVIRKMKRRKAPGPDQIPVELLKEMDATNLQEILLVLNEWWENESLPMEALQARVVLIFKKGNANELGNYRPISLLNTMYKLFAAVIQRRMADKLDHHLQKTQFGFRKNRSTADALHCIRRVIDKGEMTNTKTLLVLLDWEKAFDRVSHVGLFKCLERLQVDGKIINLIKAMYSHPTFYVEVDGTDSQWHTQNAGIRQGCPLSPYLFIALMTVLFHDVHHIHKPTSQSSRVAGMEYDEVLFADDTICISESEAAMEQMLKAIVTEGAKYGMKSNKAKCELLAFGKARPVKFSDGTRLKPQEEVKYLGCSLNSKADSRRELQKRISECMMILKKLDIFWRHGDSSLKQKMEVYNAVVKTKLIYGLESMQLTQATAQKLDTFHLKGLRKMLKMETTFVNRENNNELVYARATQALRAESTPGAARSVEKLSVSYEKAKK